MKHRYRFLIIGIVILSWVLTNQIRISQPETQNNNQDILVSTGVFFSNLTGILLSWPQGINRSIRSETLWKNEEFLYGRIYDITYKTAIGRLIEQSENYPITFIVENKKYQQYGDDFKTLEEQFSGNQINLMKDQQLGINFTHAKTFVGNKRWAIQTANLNRTSFLDNREHFFLSDNAIIRENLIALFLLDRKKIEYPHSVALQDYHLLLQDFSPNLLICPLNCRQHIQAILSQAQDRIWISAQYITDQNILNILKKKKNIDIRILTNNFDSNRNLIRALGPDSIVFESSLYNHDKLLLIDNILIVGSMNLSENALDNNREIGIVLTDPSLIQQIEPLFQNKNFSRRRN